VLTMLGVVPEWARLLIAPIHLQADYAPQEVPIAHSIGARQIAGALLLVVVGVLAVKVRRRQPAFTFAICWMAITLFPVSNLIVPTGILLAERTLFLPSVGAVLAGGAGVSWIIGRVGSRPWLRRAAVGAGGMLVLAGAVRSALRQPVWRDNATLFASLLVDAPRSYRTHWIHAGTLAAKGDRAGAELAYQRALALFQDDPRLLAEMGDRYSTMKRCSEAMRLYQRSLTLSRDTLFDKPRFNRCLTSPASPPPGCRPPSPAHHPAARTTSSPPTDRRRQ
jgi:protein O-mannosyl-transferase